MISPIILDTETHFSNHLKVRFYEGVGRYIFDSLEKKRFQV